MAYCPHRICEITLLIYLTRCSPIASYTLSIQIVLIYIYVSQVELWLILQRTPLSTTSNFFGDFIYEYGMPNTLCSYQKYINNNFISIQNKQATSLLTIYLFDILKCLAS